jgi:phosphoribosylanthranilate isomerase
MSQLSATRIAFTARREAPWVKLCGVCDAHSAYELAKLRPDAIGLNFYHRSARHVSLAMAVAIRDAIGDDILPVGVFVNEPLERLLEAADETAMAGVQLHGDEPPAFVADVREARPELAIIRAWRVGADGLEPLANHLAECERHGARPDAVLVDAHVAGSYGGTGQTAPWEQLRGYDPAWPPLILAGGLVPENVAEAIAVVRPFGVDTASGIESSPGVKDPERAAAFVVAARRTSPRLEH